MKTNLLFSIFIVASLFVGGCSYFQDPTIDENGEKIPLITINTPEFPTQINISIRDQFGNSIASEVIFKITGEDATNLISLAGKKNSSSTYKTSSGKFCLFLDPNIALSPNTPIKLTFQDGGNANSILLPASLSITKEGVYQVPLTLFVTGSTQSSLFVTKQVAPSISVYKNSELLTTGVPLTSIFYQLNGMRLTSCYPPTKGKITCSSDQPDIKYGLYNPAISTSMLDSFQDADNSFYSAYLIDVDNTIDPIITFTSIDTSYFSGSFVISTKGGTTVTTGNINAVFNSAINLPSFSIPKNDPLYISFITPSDAPYQVTPNNILLENRINVPLVNSVTNFTRYNITVELYDPNTPEVLVTPTFDFDYIRSGSGLEPITFTLKNGKAKINLIANSDYIFSTVWDGKTYSSDPVPTDPAKIEQFLKQQASSSKDIKIDKLTITNNGQSVDLYLKASSSFVSQL